MEVVRMKKRTVDVWTKTLHKSSNTGFFEVGKLEIFILEHMSIFVTFHWLRVYVYEINVWSTPFENSGSDHACKIQADVLGNRAVP